MGGAAVSAETLGPPPGVILEEDVVSFGFEAERLGNAGRAMLKAAPIGETGKPKAGDVVSEWSLRLRPAATADQCGVEDVTITVSTRITVPDWTNVETLGDDAQREWARYLAALRTYQDGHIAITTEMAGAVRETLLALPPEATCTALQAKMADAAAAVEAEYSQASADYDRETNFGKKQGAVLRKQYMRRG